MSDTEQEWKPNPRRPQSTMAQAFSLALDNAFMLDSGVSELTQSIEEKKQKMTIQARELEALQARIRETEERLKKEGKAAPTKHSDQAAYQQSRGENELAPALSPTSSAFSDQHQSESATDSDTSAATSNGMYEPNSIGKGKSRA